MAEGPAKCSQLALLGSEPLFEAAESLRGLDVRCATITAGESPGATVRRMNGKSELSSHAARLPPWAGVA